MSIPQASDRPTTGGAGMEALPRAGAPPNQGRTRASEAAASGAVDPAGLRALIRPRLMRLGLIMVALTYLVARPAGRPDPGELLRFASLLAGSALALAGASVLNQVLEIEADGLMRRTAGRPLPAGLVTQRAALVFGLFITLLGQLVLTLGVNTVTALWSWAGLLSYLLIYTPLKQGSSLATVVGAFPGAVPVLMGWAGARGSVDAAGWALFAILFLWQVPHFLAINWMYRSDYERAGFRMLTDNDPQGHAVVRQALLYALALLPVSLLPSLHGIAGDVYAFGALLLGIYYLRGCLVLRRERTGEAGRALLKASILYLPLLFALLLVDRMLLALG